MEKRIYKCDIYTDGKKKVHMLHVLSMYVNVYLSINGGLGLGSLAPLVRDGMFNFTL